MSLLVFSDFAFFKSEILKANYKRHATTDSGPAVQDNSHVRFAIFAMSADQAGGYSSNKQTTYRPSSAKSSKVF